MRFTIRDVLWLMLVGGVGAAWQAERLQHQETIVHAEKLKTAIQMARLESQLQSGWVRRGDPIDWRLADQKIPR